MRKLLLVGVVVAGIALAAGASFELKWVLAPLLGLAIIGWANATFRSMASGSGAGMVGDSGEPEPVDLDEGRTLYWCESCGTELLLLVRGSGNPPRHCGERMHERVEVQSG